MHSHLTCSAKNLDVGRLVHSASLVEIDERHKVGREIHILQKEQ